MSAPRFIMGKSGSRSTATVARHSTTGQRASVLDERDIPGGSLSGNNGSGGGIGEDKLIPEFSSADDVCPVCKTDRFLNPKLRLMVSSCYHKMCESCMDRIFSLGPEPCPVCHTTIRKAHFKPQKFEDLSVQKELAIRRKMARTFNKTEEDFVSVEAYNKYLEEVEDWTFKLLHERDVEETESAIRRYLVENASTIESNAERANREKEALLALDEAQRREQQRRKEEYALLDEQERIAREEERRAILEALEQGQEGADAESVVKQVARSSALKRSTARLAHDDQQKRMAELAAKGLRFVGDLRTGDEELDVVKEEDLLREVNLYDAGEYLYDIARRGDGYDEDLGLAVEQEKSDVGGFVVEEVWEKAVRASVSGLWLCPVLDDADIQMDGA